MKSYFIETSVIIDYLRGKDEATQLVNSLYGELSSSYLCLAELYEGIYRTTQRESHEEIVKTFFHSLDHVYSLNEKIAHKFGELRAYLKGKGSIIEDIDIFIAATCIVYDLELVTCNNKHFSHIPDLKIYRS